MRDLSRMKFLEIGNPWLKVAFPQQTICFSPFHTRGTADPKNGLYHISPSTLPKLNALLRDPDISMIACRPLYYAPWHWQWINRELFTRRLLQGRSRFSAPYAAQLLRQRNLAPIAVLDTEDFPGIKPDRFFLLSRCHTYFKRELPPDRWRLFMGTAHPDLPTRRFRGQQKFREWIGKIRPLSIGLPAPLHGSLPMTSEDKTADVFFVGDVERSSSVRGAGVAELLALRDAGIRVDIPEQRLPLDAFYKRASRAWLTWSPEGLGWDCFRHYEALACGSVPVINQPSIDRYRPLVEGEHAFYYNPAPGHLSATIRAALADKNRLRKMAAAGQAHVMAHHTLDALARHVVEMTLDAQQP